MKIADGCSACANMAYKLSEISFVYPITPSSPMASQMDFLHSIGQTNIFDDQVDIIEMQSEAGVAGAMHGALSAGMLASTFTASQGLLLMLPNMYKMAGEMLPGVIHVASRSLATHALSIFGDHQDIYAARSTGFCILSSTNVQDAYNLALVAHLSAIKASLPFLHFFDGFRTSHEVNQISEMDDNFIKGLIDKECIQIFRKRALNSDKAITKGTNQNEDIYFQSVEAKNGDYNSVADIVNYYMEKINKKINANYAPFNYYGSKNAQMVIVAMGSVCDIVKNVIDDIQSDLFGLIEVHLYRPFSLTYFKKVLPDNVKKIAVLDRTKEHGSIGEPLYLDVLSVVKDLNVEVVGGRYGLSSKNVTPNDIYDVFMMLKNESKNNFTIGIIDDITNTSLPTFNYHHNNSYDEFKIYGFGSDGMVSASKNILKILSNNKYVQGYFEYDSKKSGGVTVSHLRIHNELIKAPYYVTNPRLIFVSKDEYFYKFEIIDEIKDNGILLINTIRNEQEMNKFFPDKVKNILRRKNIKVYLINADELASKLGINGKISLIVESAILDLLGINNWQELLIDDIKDKFNTKGTQVVNANIEAVKKYKDYMSLIKVDDNTGVILTDKKDLNDMINARKGNDLTVKDLLPYRNGVFAGGTSHLEKRKMSNLVAKWNKDNCVECGICAMVCPHAAIRTFEVDDNSRFANLGKNSIIKGKKFIVGVSESDCTGCGLCINNCPKNCLFSGSINNNNESIINDLFKMECEKVECTTIKNTVLNKPLFEYSGACAGCGETPYLRLLTQIVGKRLVIANATGCSSIYGGPCVNTPYQVSWGNSLFEDNAEYGLGIVCSYNKLRGRVLNILQEKIDDFGLLNKVINNFDNYDEMEKLKPSLLEYVPSDLIDYIVPKSVWAVGGDGWAYDIGFGGIDHVLSSNNNIKILVLDTEVYSNTGGQSSKSTRIGAVAEFANQGKKTFKKDLFKIAMNYPNVYVASISLGGNMNQAIKALVEAEKHNGPSIVIAYSPCVEHGIKGGMSNSILAEKLAVECGYVLLMRYSNNNLSLDFNNPNFDKYEDFLLNETRYKALKIKNPSRADELLKLNKENALKRFDYYKSLLK